MQAYNSNGVRQERTGWRDQALSRRHRDWGFNCPAVDLDFLMVEYNLGLSAAVVEYKHNRASMPNINHPTYRAIQDLADKYSDGPLPFLIAFYWPECWAFRVYPVNAKARQLYETGAWLTEKEFVTSLYQIRQRLIDKTVLANLHDELPQQQLF